MLPIKGSFLSTSRDVTRDFRLVNCDDLGAIGVHTSFIDKFEWQSQWQEENGYLWFTLKEKHNTCIFLWQILCKKEGEGIDYKLSYGFLKCFQEFDVSRILWSNWLVDLFFFLTS